MSTISRVGFIGLGSQGGPMAVRIGDQFALHVWARRPQTLDAFAGRVARVATSPRDLAEQCDIVCVCVRADADIVEVCEGDHGVLAGLAPDALLLVHSTVHPDTVRVLADHARDHDVQVLDAPVSGSGFAAAEGRLVTIVGGDAEVLERARSVLATHSDRIFHVGDIGAGQTAKLVNNALFTAHLALGKAALRTGASLGLDIDELHQVLNAGSGRSFALEVSPGFGDDAAESLGGQLLAKDVSLLQALLQSNDIADEELLAPALRLLKLRSAGSDDA